MFYFLLRVKGLCVHVWTDELAPGVWSWVKWMDCLFVMAGLILHICVLKSVAPAEFLSHPGISRYCHALWAVFGTEKANWEMDTSIIR